MIIIYANDVVTDYDYDSRSRPTRIRVYRGGNTLLNSTYTYDSSSSITQIATTGQTTETYGYDQLDRLTSTTGPWGSITFTYDAEGNRLTRSSTSYSYNNMNRLTCIGASDDLTYDSDGNLLTREAGANHWDYSYDVSKRLITVKYNDSVQRKYQYDADGRRVRSFNGASNNFKYVYSGLSVVYEVPDGGGVPTLRLYTSGLQVAEKTDSTVTYLHQDHLGSTRLKTDSSGSAVFLTYRHHVESTVGFFKRIAPHFGIKLHIVTCRTMEDGKDVPVTSFPAKLEEAYELGKKLGASERDT